MSQVQNSMINLTQQELYARYEKKSVNGYNFLNICNRLLRVRGIETI